MKIARKILLKHYLEHGTLNSSVKSILISSCKVNPTSSFRGEENISQRLCWKSKVEEVLIMGSIWFKGRVSFRHWCLNAKSKKTWFIIQWVDWMLFGSGVVIVRPPDSTSAHKLIRQQWPFPQLKPNPYFSLQGLFTSVQPRTPFWKTVVLSPPALCALRVMLIFGNAADYSSASQVDYTERWPFFSWPQCDMALKGLNFFSSKYLFTFALFKKDEWDGKDCGLESNTG